jgi:hypothetical protein
MAKTSADKEAADKEEEDAQVNSLLALRVQKYKYRHLKICVPGEDES